MKNMIKINNDNFFGEGNCQRCYIHPSNNDLCIKISKQNIVCRGLFNEIKFWSRYSKKRIQTSEYQFFAKYHGAQETNLGTGNIFDLIKDETTNEVSKTLEYYLLNPTDGIDNKMLKTAFEELIHLMVKYKVIATDLKAGNICCKILKNKTVKLILVDGVGHRDFIPLVDWSDFFARKKIERRLVRLNLHDLDKQRNSLRKLNRNY